MDDENTVLMATTHILLEHFINHTKVFALKKFSLKNGESIIGFKSRSNQDKFAHYDCEFFVGHD